MKLIFHIRPLKWFFLRHWYAYRDVEYPGGFGEKAKLLDIGAITIGIGYKIMPKINIPNIRFLFHPRHPKYFLYRGWYSFRIFRGISTAYILDLGAVSIGIAVK